METEAVVPGNKCKGKKESATENNKISHSEPAFENIFAMARGLLLVS